MMTQKQARLRTSMVSSAPTRLRAMKTGTKRTRRSPNESLTASQQDYLEAVYRLLHDPARTEQRTSVRVTDIATALGTRLPTVTRTVARLAERGLFLHEPRQGVRLTPSGELLASAFVHRHEDLVRFFVTILGLEKERAERDTCQIEHGLSEMSAQRLHEFLEYVDKLPKEAQDCFFRFASRPILSERPFEVIPDQKVPGWRG